MGVLAFVLINVLECDALGSGAVCGAEGEALYLSEEVMGVM